MKRIGMVSLGCPKNLVDSEVMMGVLRRHGFALTTDAEDADVIVVNTCGFIDAAKQESVDTILEMAELKKTGKLEKLVVAGCLVERYRDDLRREIPEIDAVLGTSQLERIAEACSDPRSFASQERVRAGRDAITYLYSDSTPRVLATAPHTAYVKISEGCDRPCTFCVIPQMRGRFRSRSPESILREIEQLGAAGTREAILIAQESTLYGDDLGLGRNGLAELLDRMAATEAVDWIRFLYAYPTTVTDELLAVMGRHERLCAYLDVPLQHASRSMLKRMKRGGSREQYERMIERARELVPGIAVRTTFIVGFPGETEADYEQLVDFCETVEFDRVGVFTYSDEEDAEAFALDGKVDPDVAAERRDALMEIQAGISRGRNERLVGSRVRVLMEGTSEETDLLLQGRMETQAPNIDGVVLVNDVGEDGCAPEEGEFVTVEITEAHDYDLVGRIV
jgi:ribosomal protein S12 methylthiotransferase